MDEDAQSDGRPEPTGVFHFYPRLPPELKLRIWEMVFSDWSPGAHRFAITHNRRDATSLCLKHLGPSVDTSAWREWNSMAAIDEYAAWAFRGFQRRSGMTTITLSPGTGRREEIILNGRDDLVMFLYQFGRTQVSLRILDTERNGPVFRGITRIGIDSAIINLGRRQSNAKWMPFQCICFPRLDIRFCYIAFGHFLTFFDDLKVVYIITTLTKSNVISEYGNYAEPGQWKLVDPEMEMKKSQESKCIHLFEEFQNAAEELGLMQFHDQRGVYCEVRRHHLEDKYNTVSPAFDEAQLAVHDWNLFRPTQQVTAQFKQLVFLSLEKLSLCELRGDVEETRRLRRPRA